MSRHWKAIGRQLERPHAPALARRWVRLTVPFNILPAACSLFCFAWQLSSKLQGGWRVARVEVLGSCMSVSKLRLSFLAGHKWYSTRPQCSSSPASDGRL
jgi:hypothetical protein